MHSNKQKYPFVSAWTPPVLGNRSQHVYIINDLTNRFQHGQQNIRWMKTGGFVSFLQKHVNMSLPLPMCITCPCGRRGKGPAEGWSYGSTRGRGGEKAGERDSMDYSAPVWASCPPGTHIHVHTATRCPLIADTQRRALSKHSLGAF